MSRGLALGKRLDARPFKVLLAISALALTLAGMEIYLRVRDHDRDRASRNAWDGAGNSPLHVRSRDPALVYELRPNAEVYVNFLKRTFRTNAQGFRDGPFVVPKPKGTYRILAVGDSVTFGWGQEPEQTFAKLLEHLLREETGDPRVEVYNLGVGGYDAEQEAAVVRIQVPALEPDLILVSWVHNDNDLGADMGLWRHFQRSRSRALDFFRFRILDLLQRRSGMAPTRRAFAEIARVAGEHGVPVAVAIFPLLTWDDERGGARPGGDGPRARTYGLTAVHQEVASIAASHGFTVIDLEQPFCEAGLEHLRVDSIHPNVAGHALAARQMFERLKDRIPRPTAPGAGDGAAPPP